MNQDTVVYSVQSHQPVHPETAGGLFWGSTTIEPGCVGSEYFMTRGHFHAKRDRGEYYATVQGAGMLLLMGEDRLVKVEMMCPSSLHYIAGYTAHRAINTGASPTDPAVSSLLDYAAYAADNFYGIEAYHYAAPGTNNVRTKERRAAFVAP